MNPFPESCDFSEERQREILSSKSYFLLSHFRRKTIPLLMFEEWDVVSYDNSKIGEIGYAMLYPISKETILQFAEKHFKKESEKDLFSDWLDKNLWTYRKKDGSILRSSIRPHQIGSGIVIGFDGPLYRTTSNEDEEFWDENYAEYRKNKS